MTDDNEFSNQTKQVRADVACIPFSADVQPPSVVGAHDEAQTPHDFEEAIEATGYGRFNALFLLAVLPGGLAAAFDVTVMSYVLPSAECDLELTLFHKGVLNAITYVGMTTSAFLWGFLSDTKGRRSLLMLGYLADAICNVMCSMSQNFVVLVVFKFFTGFIITGPFAINMTYVAEFHSNKHRSRALLWTSLFPVVGNMVLPILAWAVIFQPWSLTFFDGAFVYNSWRILLLICSMPALLAFLALFFFPESPRFLMSQGRNDEALKVFQRMYAMNTGNLAETFPVKALCQEGQKKQIDRTVSGKSLSFWEGTRRGWDQIKPLFLKPYLSQFLLITTMQFGGILSMNTLRLWMPQLFTLMENFDYENRDRSLGAPTLCEIISQPNSPNATVIDEFNSTALNTCMVIPVSSKIYINSIIVAVTTVLGFAIAGNLVNLLGKKNLLFVVYSAPAVCAFALTYVGGDVIIALASVYVALVSISVSTIISVTVDLMPTSLRAMAVTMNVSIGRLGASIGNILFPILLSAGCMIPFIFVGGFLMVCFILTIFIPKPSAKLT